MLINLDEVSFGYDDEEVFGDCSLSINEGDRIGLIGLNGTGKTTFLNVLLKIYEPSEGDVFHKRGLTVGFLKQNSGLDTSATVYEEMNSVFLYIYDTQKKLREIAEEIAITPHESNEYIKLSEEHDRLTAYLIAHEGYNVDVKVKTVLNGMGFVDMYEQVISTMSGGEKTRLAIAKLLLESPDLLALDEPTNHLDFKTLAWLEGYLANYKGALVIVSHDRYFLDKMVDRIWELEDGYVIPYKGNYSKYKIIKAELLRSAVRAYDRQSLKIAAMKEYIEKNSARASTAKSAKSRVHRLAHISPLKRPRTYTKPPSFNFEFEEQQEKEVLVVKNLNLRIGDKELIKSANFSVKLKERVALLGANGVGKTTLLRKLFLNNSQEIKYFKHTKLGYYDQENLNLNFNNTVIEELWGRFHKMTQTYIRNVLGRVLLGEDDIDKPVSVLSGGERAKLGFAIMMAERANTLILDEPTNHLDLATREALEEALKKYEGTVIFVSHDRYFVNSIATKVLELENMELTNYAGNYDAYIEKKRDNDTVLPQDKQFKKSDYNSNNRAKDRIVGAKNRLRLRELEIEIASLESREIEVTALIATPLVASNYKELQVQCLELEKIRKDRETLYDEWIMLVE